MLGSVTSTVVKGRRLDVTVDATVDTTGEVRFTGNVNGVPVSVAKKVSAGASRVTLKVDAKKLGLKRLGEGLRFTGVVTARNNIGSPAPVQDVDVFVPLPCVYVPGFGNEATPGGATVFATALNAAAGGIYTTEGKHPTLVAREYPSTSKPLATLGKGLGKVVKAALKGTVFAKVDLVGYSYGGIVSRSFMSQGGGLRVRRCIFVASPNLGVPLAYAAVGLSQSGALDQFLGENAALADLATQLLSPEARDALKNLYPTYAWVTPDNFITRAVVKGLLGEPDTPLTALNETAPPAGVTFDAFFYTSTGVDQFGTVDTVDVTSFADLQNLDPAAIANGTGDGVAPAHSVTMDEVPAWHSVITPHDMGVGTHITILADPDVLTGVSGLLTQ